MKHLYSKQDWLYRGIICLLLIVLIVVGGCSRNEGQTLRDSRPGGESRLIITGNGVSQEVFLSLDEMLRLTDATYEHVYSIINNWPSKKMYAARGIRVDVLLGAAGIKRDARCITFTGEDGYQCSFTREQMLETQRYYYPGLLNGDASGAEPVKTIIAYEYKEDSDQLSDARPDSLCLIVPQADVNEQTNHVFVKGISRITVSMEDPGKWEKPGIFPTASKVAAGDTVKLQHKDIGKVKIYYTTDGSTPNENSKLYNPSTYQPELNKAITIDKNMTIKAFARGFGKHDSDISEFDFKVG